MNILFTMIIAISSLFVGLNAAAQQAIPDSTESEAPEEVETVFGEQTAYVFKLNDNIFPSSLRKVNRALDEAEAKEVDLFIIELNTYGGLVDIADSISNALMNAKPKTVVFVNNNAASAGALISLSCDSIFMSPDARMGAVTVVDEEGTQAPDKYQSYMRATMRAVAETNGRDPQIAEAMVDDRIEIPGIIEEGKTLTFTTSEALKHGYCEGEVESLDDLLDQLHVAQEKTTFYTPTKTDSIIDFLMNPVLSGFLLTIIFGGIYFELHSPGLGFPIFAALTAAVLYFAPYYLEGLAANWEIILFIIGVLLIGVELFVLPGFGVAGISGIVLMIAGLTLSMIGNVNFDFTPAGPGAFSNSLTVVTISFIASLAMMFLIGKSLMNSKSFGKLVLKEEQKASEGYTTRVEEHSQLIGQKGTAFTDLKISGKIDVGDQRLDAISEGGFVPEGTAVKVIAYRGNYFVVRPIVES